MLSIRHQRLAKCSVYSALFYFFKKWFANFMWILSNITIHKIVLMYMDASSNEKDYSVLSRSCVWITEVKLFILWPGSLIKFGACTIFSRTMSHLIPLGVTFGNWLSSLQNLGLVWAWNCWWISQMVVKRHSPVL